MKKQNITKITKKALFAASIVTIFSLCSCKEKLTIEKEKVSSPELAAEISFPVYEKYPMVTEKAREIIQKDYDDYVEYNVKPLADFGHQLRYRTEIEDKSNSSFINVFIKKYIYAGPTVEDEYFLSVVYNKKTKEFETVESLTGMTREELGPICEEKIFNSLTDLSENSKAFVRDWIHGGTAPTDLNWSGYSADKKEVTIHFCTGQVLSNWYGPQTVVLPRAKK